MLELAPYVPTPVWGRDELRAGEMWNSNSLISWLIARSGLDVESIPSTWWTSPRLAGRHRHSAPPARTDASSAVDRPSDVRWSHAGANRVSPVVGEPESGDEAAAAAQRLLDERMIEIREAQLGGPEDLERVVVTTSLSGATKVDSVLPANPEAPSSAFLYRTGRGSTDAA